ncbi:MAG: ATP-binding protein [Pseudomonadota bacterium]
MPARRAPYPNLIGTISALPDRREFLSTVAIIAVTAAGAALVGHLYGEVAAALIFVLGITIAGAFGGLICALAAAVVAFLTYNFYLTEPELTFRLATGRDVAPLVIFNLCAVVSGILAGRLRDHAEAARDSNERLRNLLDLSRSLQSALRQQEIAVTLSSFAAKTLGGNAILLRRDQGRLTPVGNDDLTPETLVMAEAAIAGGTTIETNNGLIHPLHGGDDVFGAIVLDQGTALTPATRRKVDDALLDASGNIVALAAERALLSKQMTERHAALRAEELKSALLSSVSHDFRTPLTAISASASSLIAYRDKLDAETSQRLLAGIVEDCERLNRYTANLLEMSRLEAGGVAATLQILSVAEMIGAALQRVRARLPGRLIQRTDCPEDLLVAANPALFELVLINVIDNAILYSPPDGRIAIRTEKVSDHCRVEIADEGEGIPATELERVFERFYRVPRAEMSPRGSGLGLAIARGFVEALAGTIEARQPGIGDKGSCIVIQLPLCEATRS